jgi:cytochrome c oxidase cbb3-type subunit I/II
MRQPDSTTPGSVMPRYPHLLTTQYDTSLIRSKMRALRTVGVPYTDGEMETAVAAMASQAKAIDAEVLSQKGPAGLEDKEIVALTAYLQRLGTDIRWKRPAFAPASILGVPAGATAGQAPISGVPAGASAFATPASPVASADKTAGQAGAVK